LECSCRLGIKHIIVFKKFDEVHFHEIERILKNNLPALQKYRKLKIEDLSEKDE
jgi:hypothetical protein